MMWASVEERCWVYQEKDAEVGAASQAEKRRSKKTRKKVREDSQVVGVRRMQRTGSDGNR